MVMTKQRECQKSTNPIKKKEGKEKTSMPVQSNAIQNQNNHNKMQKPQMLIIGWNYYYDKTKIKLSTQKPLMATDDVAPYQKMQYSQVIN